MLEHDAARFVAQMEDALDLHAVEHTEKEPSICMDKASKHLLCDEHPLESMAPGRDAREDYHYERRSVQALFMFFDPVRRWRRVSCHDSRTRVDWAEDSPPSRRGLPKRPGGQAGLRQSEHPRHRLAVCGLSRRGDAPAAANA